MSCLEYSSNWRNSAGPRLGLVTRVWEVSKIIPSPESFSFPKKVKTHVFASSGRWAISKHLLRCRSIPEIVFLEKKKLPENSLPFAVDN